MTARGYELDDALRAVLTRLREMDIRINRNRPATGISFTDTGGYYGGGDPLLSDILDLIGGGSLGGYLTVIGGGKGTVQALGTLGATETIDLANGNLFWGTLDQACTITTTGWTNLKDCQIVVELIQDGTGGWTPTFSGVTWIGGTPDWDTAAGTVTHVLLFSRDGGTTIYGAVVGAGGSLGVGIVEAHGNLGATETIDVTDGRTYHWGTLTADCTFTFSTIADTAERWFTLELIEDGTGGWDPTWPGSVLWLGGSAPTHDTTAGTTSIYAFFTRDGGTTWIGGQLGSGSASPLTTKGDLWGYDTANARVPVGSNGEFLRADSTDAQGVAWQTVDLDDLSDVTITTPAAGQRLRYNGSAWVNSSLKWVPVTTFDGTNWMLVVDGSGNATMTEA